MDPPNSGATIELAHTHRRAHQSILFPVGVETHRQMHAEDRKDLDEQLSRPWLVLALTTSASKGRTYGGTRQQKDG